MERRRLAVVICIVLLASASATPVADNGVEKLVIAVKSTLGAILGPLNPIASLNGSEEKHAPPPPSAKQPDRAVVTKQEPVAVKPAPATEKAVEPVAAKPADTVAAKPAEPAVKQPEPATKQAETKVASAAAQPTATTTTTKATPIVAAAIKPTETTQIIRESSPIGQLVTRIAAIIPKIESVTNKADSKAEVVAKSKNDPSSLPSLEEKDHMLTQAHSTTSDTAALYTPDVSMTGGAASSLTTSAQSESSAAAGSYTRKNSFGFAPLFQNPIYLLHGKRRIESLREPQERYLASSGSNALGGYLGTR
jgi:hypothetical protein